MNIVILAAGMGKRMHSALPKVLHPLAGRPLLAHVIDTARALEPTRLVVVIGHGAEKVQRSRCRARRAVRRAGAAARHRPCRAAGAAVVDPTVPTLVLYGDVPLTRAEHAEAARRCRRQMAATACSP